MYNIELRSDMLVEDILTAGGDYMVEVAARVSNDPKRARELADPEVLSKRSGLIRSLVRQRHTSPFEHGLLTFYVEVPIFIMREWMRHRTMSYNEESGRYRVLRPVFWVPERDRPMIEPDGFKPMRPAFNQLAPGNEGTAVYDAMLASSRAAYSVAWSAYQMELDWGVAREVARRYLPLATYTSAVVTVNPLNLMKFIALRTHDPDAEYPSYPQREIEEAAKVTATILSRGWPITYNAFVEYGRRI